MFPVNDPYRHWKYAAIYLGAFVAVVFAVGLAIALLIGVGL